MNIQIALYSCTLATNNLNVINKNAIHNNNKKNKILRNNVLNIRLFYILKIILLNKMKEEQNK